MLLAHAGRPDHSPWLWHAHPDVVAVSALLVLGYYLAFTRLGPRLAASGAPVVSRHQLVWLGLAIGGFWIMSDWPVHDLSEGYLYSVHMVQHLVYTLILPPMFIWGTPRWLWRWLLRPILPVFRLLTRPLLALIVFNAVIAGSHWTALVSAAVRSGPMHLGQHVILVATAFLMWWPVLSPLPELPRLAPPLQMVYLFLQSLVPTVPASFLTMAEGPIYRIYGEFPRTLGLSVVADQQLAGAIMKIGGGAILWAGIVVVFFRWFAEEDRRPSTRPPAAAVPAPLAVGAAVVESLPSTTPDVGAHPAEDRADAVAPTT